MKIVNNTITRATGEMFAKVNPKEQSFDWLLNIQSDGPGGTLRRIKIFKTGTSNENGHRSKSRLFCSAVSVQCHLPCLYF